jgi:hypothetical protein
MARVLQFAILLAALGAPIFAQQNSASATPPPTKPDYVGKAIGKATVNSTPSYTTTNLYKDETVSTNMGTHLHVISKGNTLIFSPDSKFQAWVNAFELNEGGSKVASYTGMTAYLPDCFSVTPVNPTQMTLFEVDWSSGTAYVYARSQDVKIHYWAEKYTKSSTSQKSPTKSWTVKQGDVARIPNVSACEPFVYFVPQSEWPTIIETGVASAAGPIALFLSDEGSKPMLSPPGP